MIRVLAVLGVVGLVLSAVTPFSGAQVPRKTVMVVDFADRVGNWTSTQEAVTTRVINKLRDDQSLRILPRDRVQEALRQAKVETAGLIDREEVQKVAKTLEADYAMMGEVTAFDQQQSGGCLPVVGCAYTTTAAVTLRGKIVSAATGQVVAEPTGEAKKQQSSASVSGGPWWANVSLQTFDGQLLGKATLEAVDKFVGAAKPKLN
jgi:curli biogenesis system outer membrane secretion channel CsgG